jgi:hypothetical protein
MMHPQLRLLLLFVTPWIVQLWLSAMAMVSVSAVRAPSKAAQREASHGPSAPAAAATFIIRVRSLRSHAAVERALQVVTPRGLRTSTSLLLLGLISRVASPALSRVLTFSARVLPLHLALEPAEAVRLMRAQQSLAPPGWGRAVGSVRGRVRWARGRARQVSRAMAGQPPTPPPPPPVQTRSEGKNRVRCGRHNWVEQLGSS